MTGRCSKCGAENELTKKFCGDCGHKFIPVPPPVVVGEEEGVYYCFKHKKEITRVTCGRCERPICTQCSVIGSVGVRCKSCAKNRVPIRVRGVLHDGGKAVGRVDRRVWYVALWVGFIGLFRGWFGGGPDA